jgi:hypothetical protein
LDKIYQRTIAKQELENTKSQKLEEGSNKGMDFEK